MHKDIKAYNKAQLQPYRELCEKVASIIDDELRKADSKIWHRGPVWFLNENPIVGYSVRKDRMQLLFWSGQSFDEPGLTPEGSFRAAEKNYASLKELKIGDLRRWLTKAKRIQWDYKNIVKRKGVLEKIGAW